MVTLSGLEIAPRIVAPTSVTLTADKVVTVGFSSVTALSVVNEMVWKAEKSPLPQFVCTRSVYAVAGVKPVSVLLFVVAVTAVQLPAPADLYSTFQAACPLPAVQVTAAEVSLTESSDKPVGFGQVTAATETLEMTAPGCLPPLLSLRHRNTNFAVLAAVALRFGLGITASICTVLLSVRLNL